MISRLSLRTWKSNLCSVNTICDLFLILLYVYVFGMLMSKQYILLYTLRVLHSKVDLYSTTMVCPLVWMAVVHP